MEKKLILDVHEKPKAAHWIALSIQHVLAMFGSTVLVPMLTGLPVSLALVSSGIGKGGNHRVLIFAQLNETLKLIEEYLFKREFSYIRCSFIFICLSLCFLYV